jgi:hypothetical protein
MLRAALKKDSKSPPPQHQSPKKTAKKAAKKPFKRQKEKI